LEKSSEIPVTTGDMLEYRVARLFIHLGFYVRRTRELYTVGYLDQATDLDVFAIRYTEPFRREVQICECKSGGEGPLDRVFWIAGVKKYINATNATLVRKSTKWNIKNFATEAGVEILDLPRLEEMEKNLAIPPTQWLGASDGEFFSSHSTRWQSILNRDSVLKELHLTLAGEVRFHEPFSGINFLLHHLRALTRMIREGRAPSESLCRYLVTESVVELAMFLMRVAEMCVSLSAKDQEGLIRKGLTYGNVDSKLTERIFRNAHRITGEMVKFYTGKSVQVDESLFSIPEPPELPQIQALVRLLVDRPALASSFVPITDLLVSERYLKQRDRVDWLSNIFKYADLKERVQLVNEYLRLLHSADAVPDLLWPGKKSGLDSTEESRSRSSPVKNPEERRTQEEVSAGGKQGSLDDEPSTRKTGGVAAQNYAGPLFDKNE